MARLIVGVMGGSNATEAECETAYELGMLIAREGWVLLNGGRPAGVMEASAKGAHDNGGLVVGVLPDRDRRTASQYVDIPIVTGMGEGRNYINALSSDVVVALPGMAGTLSEIAIALKNRKQVILLNFEIGEVFAPYQQSGCLKTAQTLTEVIKMIKDCTLHVLETFVPKSD